MSDGTGDGEPTRTTCARCAVGCGLRTTAVSTDDLRETSPSIRVTGDPEHPVSRGRACRRGIEETAGSRSGADRLRRPLVRRNGDLIPVSWEVALDAVAARFRPRLDTEPDRIGVFGSGQTTTEAAYLLGKTARGVIGTRNYDANTTLCMASAVTAYRDAFGADAPPPTYADIPRADTHVVWGANPAVSHPVLFSWIRESTADDGSELIVVDPVRTRTADGADRHAQLDPDTDIALARAVLATVVARGDVADEFVETHTTGFAALRDRLPDPETAAETAGVDPASVSHLADALTHPTLVYWGMGINQSVQGTAAARALIDLCLATGNLGPGTGPFSLTGQANSMGARLGASKGRLPGGAAFNDPSARQRVATAWEVPPARLPTDPGPGPVGLFESIAAGEVDTFWTVAANPAVGMPNTTPVRTALDDVFLVVQDAFRTPTVEYADVVLPAATWGETGGTLVSMDRTVSRVRPSCDPPGSARRDASIIASIAGRLRPNAVDDTVGPEALFAELAGLTAGTPADCTHVTYARLESDGSIRWPRTAAVGFDCDDSAPQRSEYRYRDPDGGFTFPTTDGLARFSTARHRSPPEPPDDRFPLVLTTARRSDAYNTGVRSGGDDELLRVRVAPTTHNASADGVDGADRAVVVSRRGRVDARVVADERVPDGVVWAPIHHPDVNRLTLDAVDPESGEPAYKACAVRLDRN